MTTRRDILKGGGLLAAILASGKAHAYLVKSMLAARQGLGVSAANKEDEEMYKELLSAFVNGTITSFESKDVTFVRDGLFMNCVNLSRASFPNALSVAERAFINCSSLSTLELPLVESVANYGINGTSLQEILLPNVVTLGNYALNNNQQTKKIILPKVTSIGTYAFRWCYALEVVDFRGVSSVPTLANANAFVEASGYKIVVPDSLYTTWKSTSPWTNTSASYGNINGSIIKASDYESQYEQ